MSRADLCAFVELPDPGSRGFVVDTPVGPRDIFVVRRGDTVRAYVNSCPHTGGPLDWVPDQFLSLDRTHIQCATHDALFQIDDGHCVAGPCAGDHLTALPAGVADGRVWVDASGVKV